MTDRPPATKLPSQSDKFDPSLSDSSTAYALDIRRDPRRDPPEHRGTERIEIQETTSGFRRRRFPLRWSQRRQDSRQTDAKDPFGLRLLHASPQPLIDIIFVHGLRGGSSKTWRKGDDPRLFWPQYWLPMEPDMCNASIHSFGYDSDWGSLNPSALNVHDFGQTLYEELRSSPYLRQNTDAPIILIGHSMGGLVIKKAYVAAHQDQTFRQLAHRIRCIFFLATPHKGSEYAATLNRILKISGMTGMTSSREYINELSHGSTSAQLINEDFGRYASSLQIYSFYETLETSLGVSSSIIVDKNSAVLGPGFNNETARYMNANHRGICKFESPEDPNYLSLKNSLSSAVQSLLKESLITHEETSKTQLRGLQTFLGISAPPDDNYEQLEGSCQWIDERDDFREWRDADADIDTHQGDQFAPSIYWVNANPGAGKTVLAAHVVSHLAEFSLPGAFYHFHVGKKALQSLAGCLRSIAFQMAMLNSAIRTKLSDLRDDGVIIDPDDARAIWSKIFKAAILQTPRVTTQYWILDAIDECYGYPELFTFLKGLRSTFPLKIFVTSRKLPDFPKLIRQIDGCVVHVVEIPIADTMRDISLYIRDRMDILPIDRDEDKEKLAQEILSKSSASFLWVRLVLDELEKVYGYESIMSVLHTIPEGMMSYYRRTIAEMSENKRERHIIQAILTWVVCASRPLTILEITEALRMDIKVHLPSAKTAIEGLCGQLVSVDKQTNLVQIVHSTAREFLLSNEADHFKISRSEANERLAHTCLQLLASPSMQPPRHRRQLVQNRQGQPASPLLDYSITEFSEHILASSAESDKLLVALNRFLCATVLTWIEKITAGKNLHCLIRVARNLKAYLDRRAKYRSPLNQHVNTVACWAADLSRLATKFGWALTLQPQSIYFLIPPLCPTDTAIYKQYGRSPDGLSFSGFTSKDWDDCAGIVNFEDETAATVSCVDQKIAVGFESGNIQLYTHGSYQKAQTIRHMYPIERLLIDPSGALIVSASIKYLTVWDLDGNQLWQERLRSRCILLMASSSLVICVLMSGKAIWWDIATGEQLKHHHYPHQTLMSLDQLPTASNKAPFTGSFNPGTELLALGYRSGPICIYELHSHEWIGCVVDENSRNITHLEFNPNPDVNLLLVAYDDSQLSLYEPWSGALMHSQKPETDAVLQSLSCSLDGRTFSTIDAQGNLRIWDFESLTILYHVLTPNSSFRVLNFASDGFNLIDVVDHEMRIWAPSALVRKTIEEEGSISDQAAVLPVTAGQYERFRSVKLRAAVSHENSPIFIAGNYNGDVIAYNRDGNRTGSLYSHPNSIVKCLALSKSSIIASSDTNGVMQVWQLDTSQIPVVRSLKQKLQVQFKTAVLQLLFDSEDRYLLVSTADSDRVYEVETGMKIGSLDFHTDERKLWRWTSPSISATPGMFLLVCDGKIISYSAKDFPSEIAESEIGIELKADAGFSLTTIDSITLNQETSSMIIDITQNRGYLTTSILFIFQIPEIFSAQQLGGLVEPKRVMSSDNYMHFLGVDHIDGRLVFLNKNSWVCSVKLSALTDKHYTRHFFVPNEFTTSAREIPPLLTAEKSLIFALHDKFAVIKNGLVFQEVVALDGGRE
ncbi:NACHT and WD domain protein [Nemania sp. NC0429]|nr:NACHT and WD domain protein [Nemania sp. NC0429]